MFRIYKKYLAGSSIAVHIVEHPFVDLSSSKQIVFVCKYLHEKDKKWLNNRIVREIHKGKIQGAKTKGKQLLVWRVDKILQVRKISCEHNGYRKS